MRNTALYPPFAYNHSQPFMPLDLARCQCDQDCRLSVSANLQQKRITKCVNLVTIYISQQKKIELNVPIHGFSESITTYSRSLENLVGSIFDGG